MRVSRELLPSFTCPQCGRILLYEQDAIDVSTPFVGLSLQDAFIHPDKLICPNRIMCGWTTIVERGGAVVIERREGQT